VVIGTTFGMIIANVPVLYVGSAVSQRISFRAVRFVAALLFAVLGAAALMGIGS